MRTTAVCTVRVREEEYAALARLTAEVARVTRALFHRMSQLDQPVEARDALRGVMAEGVVLKRHTNSALLEAQGLARAWKERSPPSLPVQPPCLRAFSMARLNDASGIAPP